MTKTALFALSVLGCFGTCVRAQEPAPPQPATPPAENAPAPASKGIPTRAIPGFLIIGTVFNEDALSYPGVEVRIRRAGEKKYRWDTYTNSRGEFAVRVPEGHEYEVLVRVKKYKDHVEKVTTANGDVQQRLSIRLEPVDAGKKGAKP